MRGVGWHRKMTKEKRMDGRRTFRRAECLSLLIEEEKEECEEEEGLVKDEEEEEEEGEGGKGYGVPLIPAHETGLHRKVEPCW